MDALSKVLTFAVITTTLSYTMDPPLSYTMNPSTLSGQALFEQNVFWLNDKLRSFIYDFARWPKEEQNKVIPHAHGGLSLVGGSIALDYEYGDPGLGRWLHRWGIYDSGQYEPFRLAINYLKELPDQ